MYCYRLFKHKSEADIFANLRTAESPPSRSKNKIQIIDSTDEGEKNNNSPYLQNRKN
jgi:hypothetical protein